MGSIQNIPTISQELKDIYKTVWELSQKSLIEMSAEEDHLTNHKVLTYSFQHQLLVN
jgi:hypothetical protein